MVQAYAKTRSQILFDPAIRVAVPAIEQAAIGSERKTGLTFLYDVSRDLQEITWLAFASGIERILHGIYTLSLFHVLQ
jgi:hypothetical protein